MTNPLLGKRISLVSKKNIRYEGVLYSINEQNATVALQNVRTFGTEGRETAEEGCIYVAPTETVHPYLLFRGQDIKDLHVHEQSAEEASPAETPTPTPAPTPAAPKPVEAKPVAQTNSAAKAQQPPTQTKAQDTGGRGGEGGRGGNRRSRNNNNNNKAAPGTGASLLNRTARGVVGGSSETPQEDFDFQSSLEKFKEQDEDEQYDHVEDGGAAYEKDDFFDSISCDALDKQSGVDNRLKGADERRLNTETFGAVALNTQSRRRAGGRGGRGRGRDGRGGRGRGRGRGGRGRGRGQSVTSE